jgi:hypothetical protein
MDRRLSWDDASFTPAQVLMVQLLVRASYIFVLMFASLFAMRFDESALTGNADLDYFSCQCLRTISAF